MPTLRIKLERRQTVPPDPLQAAQQGHSGGAQAQEVQGFALKAMKCFYTAPGTCIFPQEEHFRSYGNQKVLLENRA